MSYEVGSHPIVRSLASLNRTLIYISIATLLVLLSVFFLSASTNASRFLWVGIAFFISGLIITLVTVAAYLLLPAILDRFASGIPDLDSKTLVGINRLISTLLSQQQKPLVLESAGITILGIALILFGRGIREEKVEIPGNQARFEEAG
ncbi:MAG: hypothetical protein BWY68_00416 [bacterium ADurb.Bin400]|nr:MAG: hypothetical protein BWY68_00416 [bacterium ADurb.Bin400]